MMRRKEATFRRAYIILAGGLLLYAFFFLFFSFGKTRGPEPLEDAPYGMGYYLITPDRGEMRVIPLAGTAVKSPSSTTTGIISPPFPDGKQSRTIQNSRPY